MDIVKKNILSILCGVVALVGVIAWFFPIGGMYEELEGKVKASADKYDQVEALRKAARVKPTVVLDGDPEPLGRFPNEKTIEVGRQATSAMAEQSKRMLGTVTDQNIHTPLTPRSLPNPEPSARLDFTYDYLTKLGWGEQGWRDPDSLPAQLKATVPPSTEQITAKARQTWAEKFAVQVVEIGGQNNLDQISDQFQAEVKNLPDRLREQAALDHKVYLNEDALPVSPAITAGVNPTDPDIWFAQTALWITEDVAKSIMSANREAKDITVAPVKHIVSLTVPFGVDQYVRAGGKKSSGGDGGGESAAIPVDENGAPAVWSASPTGRVSNDLYDVIHFELALRVEASRVPQVIAELERNQLVTVIQTSITAVDAKAARKQDGFVYGNVPVVEVQFKCEALFLRSWTIDKENGGKNALMPAEVQQAIGAMPKAAKEGGEGG